MSERDPEFLLKSRLSNARMVRLRREMGFERARDAAVAASTAYETWLGFENLRKKPTRKTRVGTVMDKSQRVPQWVDKGEWGEAALKIAKFLGVSPAYLWPEVVQAVQGRVVQTEITAKEVELLSEHSMIALSASSEDLYDQDELKSTVRRQLARLTPREEKVVRMRFGIGADEHTLEEVGDVFSVSAMRILQLEKKALRKLRHPSRSERLAPFFGPTKR